MSLGLSLYSTATSLLHPFLPLIMNDRVRKGKDREDRVQERFGQTGVARPDGPLVWLHGASIGESQILTDLVPDILVSRPDVTVLITTQTLTSADLIARKLDGQVIHQMAPLDTPQVTARFLNHWKPSLAVFSEGDIWPNLLRHLRKRSVPTALINARMTEKSLASWERYRGAARTLFAPFNYVSAANELTANALERFRGIPVPAQGNLKHAAAALPFKASDLAQLKADVGQRAVFAALSTHPGEDEVALEAWRLMSKESETAPFLILAPRHPERSEHIQSLMAGHSFAVRSKGEAISANTDILLADTIGEMGLWFRLAACVYLGGGHASSVGGHNPVEATKLETPVISGPDVFNFEEDYKLLINAGAAFIAETPSDIARIARPYVLGGTHMTANAKMLHPFLDGAEAARSETLTALLDLLPEASNA